MSGSSPSTSPASRGAAGEVEVFRVPLGAVSAVRLALTAAFGVLAAGYLLVTPGFGMLPSAVVSVAVVLACTWMWLTHRIDVHVSGFGVSLRLGGLLAKETWALEDMKTVQIRRVPQEKLGLDVGGTGLKTSLVVPSEMKDVRAVAPLKPRTFAPSPAGAERVKARYSVTRGGDLVEIVRHDRGIFLLSPTDPDGCAEAIARRLVAHRTSR